MDGDVNRAAAGEAACLLRHYAQTLAEIKGGVLDCADALEHGRMDRGLRRRLDRLDRAMEALSVKDQPLTLLVDLVSGG